MIRILLIGTFLSDISGSKSVSEKLNRDLAGKTLSLKLVSQIKPILFRYFDIVASVLFRNYNKIHIDTFSGLAFRIAEAASFLALLRGKKPIVTLRGGALPEFFIDNNERVQKVFARASVIQTPSLYLQDFFTNNGFKVNYLPNPINLDRFPYQRDSIKPHTLLWVRAFTSIYNPDLAVKILFEVQKQYPDSTLTMIGPDKGLLNSAKEIIKELGLNSSINIVGPVNNDQLYNYYQTHEVFLNTTSYESFGVAVVEAASCGIPVVSTKVGEIPFLWQHEENMLYVDGLDAKKFADEVIRLFNSKELAIKISKNARIKAEAFDWEKIKLNWLQLLTDQPE